LPTQASGEGLPDLCQRPHLTSRQRARPAGRRKDAQGRLSMTGRSPAGVFQDASFRLRASGACRGSGWAGCRLPVIRADPEGGQLFDGAQTVHEQRTTFGMPAERSSRQTMAAIKLCTDARRDNPGVCIEGPRGRDREHRYTARGGRTGRARKGPKAFTTPTASQTGSGMETNAEAPNANGVQ